MSITAIVFLFIFIMGCLAAFFIDPSYGISLYIFEYFLNPAQRWWGWAIRDVRFAYIIGIVIIIGYVLRSKEYSNNRVFSAPQTKWLLLLVIVIILTWPFAVWQDAHQKFMIIFIKYFLLYVFTIKIIDTPQKFNRLMGVFLLGQFYLGWLAYEYGRSGGSRLEKLGGADSRDANGTAAVMIVAVPIALNYLITGKKWQKICVLPILVFILNAIILLNSRGAFVGLIVSLAYYLFFSFKAPSFPKFNKKNVFIGFAAGIVLFMYLADPVFLDRMKTITTPEEEIQGYTGRERVEYWFYTFDMLKDHPFGTGVAGFNYLSQYYLPHKYLGARGRAVHSMYFEVLSEYSYHGFLIFMIFLSSNFGYLRRLRKSLIQKQIYEPYYMALALESGFLSVLIAGVFVDSFYLEINYWLAAYFAAYGNIYFKEMKRMDEIDFKDQERPREVNLRMMGGY